MRIAGMIAAALTGATLLAAGPAFADPKGCPPGLKKQDRCHEKHDRARWGDGDRWEHRERRRDLDEARERAYEEGYRDAMREAWRVGQRLPRERYRVVPDFDQFGWPEPGDGRGYVRYDDQYYLVNLATGIIIDILSR